MAASPLKRQAEKHVRTYGATRPEEKGRGWWGVVGVEALGGERVLDVLAAHVGGEDDVDVEVDDGDTRHQKADNCEFQLHFVFSDPESHWNMKKLTLFLPRRLRSDRTRNKILAAMRSNNLLTGGHLLIN